MRRWTRQLIVAVALVTGLSNAAWALPGDPSSASANFRVVEGEVGGNGQFNTNSANFTFAPSTDDGGSSLGAAAVGNSASTNFQTNGGLITTAQPSLTFIISSSAVNMGTLSTSVATFGTATFNVKDYTSYGYAVTLVGSAPRNGAKILNSLATDTASSAGSEQFGVNTVRNTSASQGADPSQVPGATFSYGVAGDGVTGTYGTTRPYTISDKFRFVSGETVASGPKSSGETDFNMTFLANISTATAGGTYSGNMQLVATGTY